MTLPAPMVAPRSPTNWPTNAISVSMSMAGGLGLLFSVVVMLGLPPGGIPGGCWCRTLRGGACRPVATALQPAEGRVAGMRAREPDTAGARRREGVRLAYETFNDAGDDTVVFVADRHVRAQPRVEGAGAVPGPALPRRHDRPAGQRAVRTLDRPGGVRRPGVRRRHARGPGPARRRAGRAGRHLRQRLAGAARRGPAPRRVEGVVAVAPWARDYTPPIADPAGGRTALRRGARRLQRLVRSEPPLHPGPLAGVRPRSSSASMLCEPHSTKQLEDIHGYNCDTSGHVMLAENGSAGIPARRRRRRPCCAGSPDPCW